MCRFGRAAFVAGLVAAMLGVACRPGEQATTLGPQSPAAAIARHCPPEPLPRVIEIREANPDVNLSQHDAQRAKLFRELRIPNTTVLLGPDVVLDFSKPALVDSDSDDVPQQVLHVPLRFGPCVTLMSVASFLPEVVVPVSSPSAAASVVSLQHTSARTPHSRGPLLRFGSHSVEVARQFLSVRCSEDPDVWPNDHVRISGFRLEGPSLGQQKVDQFGIEIRRCLDVEISNMEIFGWGGAGIRVLDDGPGDRIGRPEHVRILNNYIHHNQHESEDESVDCDCSWYYACLDWLWCVLTRKHAAGYGVDVHDGAWAQIFFNLFDENRHAIAAAGLMGGYDARWNLTLKGGGLHGRAFHKYTHQFDIHGSGDNGMGGQAGEEAWFFENSFQYRNGHAIKIRGRPRKEINIGNNIFPHKGLEHDWGDDAIAVRDRDDLDVIKLGPGNVIEVDTYGRYGICDFDGDGIDDLFLATGKTWWFSSAGEFPWSYLTARTQRIEQVRLGYFDDDLKCDVLTQSGADWVISSGGTGPWTSIGSFGASLAQVAFGQFDPNHRDHRPEATRRTTHAFRRLSNGQWQVTPLSAPAWTDVQSSSLPMSKLRFGDFTGDGVTDVLGVVGGRWAISESARGSWSQLNPTLGDDVSTLFIADLNHNNIDDLLKLEKRTTLVLGQAMVRNTYTWYVSDDGRSPWRELKKYQFDRLVFEPNLSGHAFAGRFGLAPGSGVILTGSDRFGNFFSPAEKEVGALPDWRSLFGY
jgi:hypothetical protein